MPTRAGSLALAAGVVALGSAVGAGQAAEPHEGQLAAAAPAAQTAPVVAGSEELTFPRSGVGSEAAPAAAPAPVEPAGKASAPAPPAKALAAPLAQLRLTSPFGPRASPFGGAAEMHTGADFGAGCSTPVLAAGAGTVSEAGWHPYGGGNRIVIDHGNGLKTTYNHLASIGVSIGQAVAIGQRVAGVGSTGASTGCHLHFEVLLGGQTVNPMGFI
ncbi:M23 family metallopeptidase [Sinomonas mesophila]|uniref:M23 family metallopeptidase n=1 Tax=Sinomonas mesophila TaxID=1531955 RepID=UPI001115703A|nr:M23 family metallopeptidase [Sinomonas mesophila]